MQITLTQTTLTQQNLTGSSWPLPAISGSSWPRLAPPSSDSLLGTHPRENKTSYGEASPTPAGASLAPSWFQLGLPGSSLAPLGLPGFYPLFLIPPSSALVRLASHVPSSLFLAPHGPTWPPWLFLVPAGAP